MDNNKKQLILNKIMGIGFIGYFLVLLAERIVALSLSINAADDPYLFDNGFFPKTAYIITAISVVAGFIILIKPIIQIFIRAIKNVEYDFGHNFKQLIIGSMALLVSGMMHTGKTIAPLQFVAYGFLIVAMLMKTIEKINEGTDKFPAIMSLIYLVCFSMSIPVCYMTNLTGALGISFYVVEFLATFTLIPCFGIMLYDFFMNGVSKFHPCPFSIAVVLAGLTVGLKWTDEINYFVLGALIATIISYIIYQIVTFKTKKK